jgi:uncharacterized flavoprotein (TIGR03862 family)
MLGKPFIAIIGGGPAGLMAAETLAQAGAEVHVYDAMPSVGRKFLRAGVGGLNLTHSEPLEAFLARYSQRERLEPILRAFGPQQMLTWAKELGFETFVGTSGRIFPVGMKASPILRAWLKRLDEAGVVFHTSFQWAGFAPHDHGDAESTEILKSVSPCPVCLSGKKCLRFVTSAGEELIHADAVILALGGGSWPKLGSTGSWVEIFVAQGIPVAPLKPANCGFDVGWSEHFRAKFDGAPLKAVAVTFNDIRKQGEFIVTKDGVEGSLIYALSAPLRAEIEQKGVAVITLDLAPDWSIEKLVNRLAMLRGSRSMSSHLEKAIGLKGVKAGLVWEYLPREVLNQPEKLATALKALRVPLTRPRPLAEAISSAGGVRFEALDAHLMLRDLPGVFCAGEMLDWEAPTGGYLLTACMATGQWAAAGVLKLLNGQ